MPWKVTLRVPYAYTIYHPHAQESMTLELRDGETARDLVRRAGLPVFEFGIVVVDGERQLMDYRPKDGETLELLPIIAGGRPTAPSPSPPLGGEG